MTSAPPHSASPGAAIAAVALVGLLLLGVGLYVLSLDAAPPPPPAPTPPPPVLELEPPPQPAGEVEPEPVAVITVNPPDPMRGLETLGELARFALEGRKGFWKVEPTRDGFVSLQHTESRSTGTLHYFELRPARPTGKLRAAVTVQCDPQTPEASAGLLYGDTARKTYYLLGVTSGGRAFVKRRAPDGLHEHLSGSARPGPHRLGVQELDGSLAIFVDGAPRLRLGGAVDPRASVGVFVLGPGVAKFQAFELDLD